MTIGMLLDQTSHDRGAFLKVDIEGAKAGVFARNTEAWLDRVDRIAIELHGHQCTDILSQGSHGRRF